MAFSGVVSGETSSLTAPCKRAFSVDATMYTDVHTDKAQMIGNSLIYKEKAEALKWPSAWPMEVHTLLRPG